MSILQTSLPAELPAWLQPLFAQAGMQQEILAIAPCPGGGNNRIFRIDTQNGHFAAKQYFRHGDDQRDRLGAEYAFIQYAQQHAAEHIPHAIACNPQTGIALYEFLAGNPIPPGGVGKPHIDAAITFIKALNHPDARQTAQLPVASEACFSIRDHLTLLETRISRLQHLPTHAPIDAQAQALIQGLQQRWHTTQEEIRQAAQRWHLQYESPLPQAYRCISPSDFGFHNALQDDAGNIRFLDFEYAGWDDPAKLIGDFFAQLAVPVPAEYYDHFSHEIMQVFPDAENNILRAHLLRKVYQLKWCCIALNVFLPVHLERRRFANPGLDVTQLKISQLQKAEQLLHSVSEKSHGLP